MALLLVVALAPLGVGVSALSKLTHQDLDADRTYVAVIGAALLVLAGSLVALAVYLGCFAQRGRRR